VEGKFTSKCTGGTRRTLRCGPLSLLEKSLGYYRNSAAAEGTAKKQAMPAPWPKMTSPAARIASPVGRFSLAEPHPIFYAELCWREHQDKATLEKYRESFFKRRISWPATDVDTNTSRYVLGRCCNARRKFPEGQKHSIRPSN